MAAAEDKFKRAVWNLIDQNIYPSPGNIRKYLERPPGGTINGKESNWRLQIFDTLPETHWVMIQYRKNKVGSRA